MAHGSDPAAAQAALLRCLPVAVLADPSPSKPNAGVVLSVAPLLGADPVPDAKVSKWLHVHVRPSVRGLLRVLRSASHKKGGFLAAMRQLADGHWVLAFPDGEKAAAAQNLVQQHGGKLRELYKELLSPLSGSGGVQRMGVSLGLCLGVPGRGPVQGLQVVQGGNKGGIAAAAAVPSAADKAAAVGGVGGAEMLPAAEAAGVLSLKEWGNDGVGGDGANSTADGSQAPYGEAGQLHQADVQQQESREERTSEQKGEKQQQQQLVEEGDWGVLNEQERQEFGEEESGWEGGDDEDLLDSPGSGGNRQQEQQQHHGRVQEVVGERVGSNGWEEEDGLGLELDDEDPVGTAAVAGGAGVTGVSGGAIGEATDEQQQDRDSGLEASLSGPLGGSMLGG